CRPSRHQPHEPHGRVEAVELRARAELVVEIQLIAVLLQQQLAVLAAPGRGVDLVQGHGVYHNESVARSRRATLRAIEGAGSTSTHRPSTRTTRARRPGTRSCEPSRWTGM